MFGFCPLASGSKGNSLYLGSRKTKVLIDAGISAKLILERLKVLSVNLTEIQAILITHDHSDHIKGLAKLIEVINIPILANAETAKGILSSLRMKPKFKIFTTGEAFEFHDLKIHPFSVPHDTLDPVAFTIEIEKIKLGVCTDLGHVTSMILSHLQRCDYLYLESNHEPSMVHASKRPQMLKNRILGKQGHLSNSDCAKLIAQIYHTDLKHVHLAHLSSECNEEQVAIRVVKEFLDSQKKRVELSIAHQEKISNPIFF